MEAMPTPRPAMMLVAWPVWLCSAMLITGACRSSSSSSVMMPTATPVPSPITVAMPTSDQVTSLPPSSVPFVGQNCRASAKVATAITAAEPNDPASSASCGLPPSLVRTTKVPRIEQTMPPAAMTSGRITGPLWL